MILVLVYLLLSAGGASAFFMCHEPDGYAHLEYNPAGQCQSDCDTSAAPKPDNDFDFSSLEKVDASVCADFALNLEITRYNVQKNVSSLPAGATTINTRPISPQTHALPVRLLHAPQPPPLALVALRTIVLII